MENAAIRGGATTERENVIAIASENVNERGNATVTGIETITTEIEIATGIVTVIVTLTTERATEIEIEILGSETEVGKSLEIATLTGTETIETGETGTGTETEIDTEVQTPIERVEGTQGTKVTYRDIKPTACACDTCVNLFKRWVDSVASDFTLNYIYL